jgi:hypothetical protein
MTLKLHGKLLDLNPEPPSTEKLRKLLAKLPKNEIFLPADIAKKVGISVRVVQENNARFEQFTVSYRGKRYWGSAAAIRTLRKRVGA